MIYLLLSLPASGGEREFPDGHRLNTNPFGNDALSIILKKQIVDFIKLYLENSVNKRLKSMRNLCM